MSEQHCALLQPRLWTLTPVRKCFTQPKRLENPKEHTSMSRTGKHALAKQGASPHITLCSWALDCTGAHQTLTVKLDAVRLLGRCSRAAWKDPHQPPPLPIMSPWRSNISKSSILGCSIVTVPHHIAYFYLFTIFALWATTCHWIALTCIQSIAYLDIGGQKGQHRKQRPQLQREHMLWHLNWTPLPR